MAIGPISFKRLLKKTDDIYESVVVSSRRAKQILQERVLKQIIEENTELQEEEEGILSEPVIREEIDFDKEEKVTTIALDEYLEGKVDWKKTEESIDQES
jgi:DNA-directed RNA polymerase subunit K/omega